VIWDRGEYLRGHSQVAKFGKIWIPLSELPLCACGCGEQVQTRQARFIKGHSSGTEELRQANSERMKANNPMQRPEVSKRQRATWRVNGWDKVFSEKMKEMHANGEITPPKATEAFKQRASARMTANNPMKNADVVARVIETSKANGSYEVAGERFRRLWGKPGYRAAQVARMKAKNPMYQAENLEKSLRNRAVQGTQSGMELWFANLCEHHELPVWYTGLGGYWVKGRNPDFKVHDRKLVIEVTDGYTYKKMARTTENYSLPTIAHYEAHRHTCLVVWMPERRYKWKEALQDSLVTAIQTFLESGKSAIWSFIE